MAPANSPGRKKRDRDNQFFEVGVQGRKTGITLPVNDKDEHGIENLDGIFSSPEKSPAKPSRTLRNGNTTLTSSDMDLAQSSVPEPTEVLSTRRLLKSSKTVFPPPLGRSPYKTNIGSSPRRQSSVAPMSQARHVSRSTERDERASSHPVVSRRLDFSVDDTELLIVQSPLRQAARRGNGRARKDIYQLTASPERPLDIRKEEEVDTTAPEEVTEAPLNGTYEDDVPMMDDSMQLLDEEPDQLPPSSPSVLRKSRTNNVSTPEPETALEAEPTEETSIVSNPRRRTRYSLTNGDSESSAAKVTKKPLLPKPSAKGGRGRKGKAGLLVAAPIEPVEDSFVSEDLPPAEESTIFDETMDESAIEQVPPKRRGRPAAKASLEETVDESLTELPPPKKRGRAAKPAVVEETLEESAIEQPRPKKRGRTAKAAVVEENPDDSAIEQPQAKKRGRPAKKADESIVEDETATPAADESIAEPVQKKKRGRPPKADTEDPSRPAKKAKTSAKASATTASKMGPPTFKKPAARAAPDSPSKRSVRAPSVASTAFAGARSYMQLREGTPLEDEGARITRSGRIAVPPLNFWLGEKVEYGRDGAKLGVKFAEIVDVPKIERSSSGPPRRKRKAAQMHIIEEEEPETLEDWEARKETISLFVNRWDPVLGTTGDEEEEQAIAYGVNSVDIETVGGGAKFSFVKTHSSHFFGTGIMEIPPGGFKLKKNSRKMTMAFFMHTGKVDVMVADTEFTISKGGIFHVPRGNIYSIHNPGEKTARIFFAQGCQVPVDVDE